MNIKTDDVIKNKNESIKVLNNYLDECISKDNKHLKKANLISYWLKDYVRYIEAEEYFSSEKLKKYNRGDIIKVNLGFNIGNEEGGLHYCVVLDIINAKKYSTLTVIPLTSQKENKVIPNSSVLLGTELYDNLSIKYEKLLDIIYKKIDICLNDLKFLNELPEQNEDDIILKQAKLDNIREKLNSLKRDCLLTEKVENEIAQMKDGSIALVNQITTISKQRIYNPKSDIDVLSGIKLSSSSLDLIDNKIKQLFIKK